MLAAIFGDDPPSFGGYILLFSLGRISEVFILITGCLWHWSTFQNEQKVKS